MKMFLFLVIPRIVPPVGIGIAVWTLFRAFLSPSASYGFERVLRQFPRDWSKWYGVEKVNQILANQWGHYDPNDLQQQENRTRRQMYQTLFEEFQKQFEEFQRQQHQQQYYQQQQQQQFYQQQQQQQQEKHQRSHSSSSQPPPQEDYYQILNVKRNVSNDELKQAFRKQILLYHPDHYQGNDPEYAKKRTQQIVEAYRTLSNPSKRSVYDSSN